jgi:hypothetical protein
MSVVNVSKLFVFVTDAPGKHVRAFVLGKTYQASLIFVDKTSVYRERDRLGTQEMTSFRWVGGGVGVLMSKNDVT